MVNKAKIQESPKVCTKTNSINNNNPKYLTKILIS